MLQHLGGTFLRPTETLQTVLRHGLDTPALLRAAGLLAAIAGISAGVIPAPQLPDQDPDAARMTISPFVGAIIHFLSTVILAGMINAVGRAFGGSGDFNRALFVSVWVSAAFLIPSLLIEVIGLSAPALYQLGVLVMVGWQGVVLTRAVQVVHGFSEFLPTFLGMIATLFLLGLVALFFVNMAGVAVGS